MAYQVFAPLPTPELVSVLSEKRPACSLSPSARERIQVSLPHPRELAQVAGEGWGVCTRGGHRRRRRIASRGHGHHWIGRRSQDGASQGLRSHRQRDLSRLRHIFVIRKQFPRSIDGDLLNLIHLSNGYRMLDGPSPLHIGDIVNTDAGKAVEVIGNIIHGGSPLSKSLLPSSITAASRSQGYQEPCMGIELCDGSPAARTV